MDGTDLLHSHPEALSRAGSEMGLRRQFSSDETLNGALHHGASAGKQASLFFFSPCTYTEEGPREDTGERRLCESCDEGPRLTHSGDAQKCEEESACHCSGHTVCGDLHSSRSRLRQGHGCSLRSSSLSGSVAPLPSAAWVTFTGSGIRRLWRESHH